jgi:hypothetical protein
MEGQHAVPPHCCPDVWLGEWPMSGCRLQAMGLEGQRPACILDCITQSQAQYLMGNTINLHVAMWVLAFTCATIRPRTVSVSPSLPQPPHDHEEEEEVAAGVEGSFADGPVLERPSNTPRAEAP